MTHQQPAVPGPPQAGWAPPPSPSRKRGGRLVWILAGAGAVVALGLGIGLVGVLAGGDKAAPAAGSATRAAAGKGARKAAAARIGDKVRDGKFEFTVTGVDCTKSTVGEDILNKRAQGKFCIIAVTVVNIGDEPRTFTGANQKAYVGAAEYHNDSTAEFYINSDTQTFLEDVNPGDSVKGKLVFDIPKAAKLTEIELHDSLQSDGVRVALN
jgi:hypothetical protein